MFTSMAVLSYPNSYENVQKMKCIENIREIDYYNEILNYFEATTAKNIFVFDQNDKWVDFSYLKLLNDLNHNKVLMDADIADVVKNCFILILGLIEMRNKPIGTSYECCSDEDQIAIRQSLVKTLV